MIEDGELALVFRTYAWNLRVEVEYRPTATKTCTEAKVKGRGGGDGLYKQNPRRLLTVPV
jgi:hypothetical protein